MVMQFCTMLTVCLVLKYTKLTIVANMLRSRTDGKLTSDSSLGIRAVRTN